MQEKLHEVKQPRMGVLRQSGKPDLWKRDGVIHNGLRELPEIQAILKSHDYRCHFCGFIDPKFIEPHHLNGNHYDHSAKNVVPACTLCHASHHLFAVSQNQSAAFGLFRDNISQTNLNHIQRLLICFSKHPDEKIRAQYGLNGQLYSRCFDMPLSLHERRLFTDFTDFDFQEMMFEDVKKYKEYVQILNEKVSTSALGSNSESIDHEVYFQGDIDSPDVVKRKEDEDDEVVNARIVKFQEQFKNYKTWYRKRIDNNKNFTVFQLSMALAMCNEEAYKNFHLNSHNLLLCFNANIFTQEQIDYYLSRPDFDIIGKMASFDAAQMIPVVDEQLKSMKVDLG
jgi:hypothetical protein